MHSEEVPHIRIGVRLMRSMSFNMFKILIERTLAKWGDATVEVVPFPEQCDVAVIEQGTLYSSAPDAYPIHITHREAQDPYQVSMRLRREIKEYYAMRYT